MTTWLILATIMRYETTCLNLKVSLCESVIIKDTWQPLHGRLVDTQRIYQFLFLLPSSPGLPPTPMKNFINQKTNTHDHYTNNCNHQWGLLGTLFLGWVIVYLIIWKVISCCDKTHVTRCAKSTKSGLFMSEFVNQFLEKSFSSQGLHSSGKIVWFTALFPYFVMITLLFR